MTTLWFIIVALMLTAYVVLDGFDLGAGIVHRVVARDDAERRAVLRAIGPVWDGNEVWLLAAGGVLYFAFPALYAASFSGFYLPLIMVLWLLMLRGIGIELRSHLESPVWRSLFDTVFMGASALLAIFFGAALGNVIRGVPLNADGYFFEPLWTNWRTSGTPGILDWYTVLAGVVAFVALTSHGALYLMSRTYGDVSRRARVVARFCWGPLIVLTFASLVATVYIRPELLTNYTEHPIWLLIPLLVGASLLAMEYFSFRFKDGMAFASSCVYLATMLGGAAVALYPNVLPATDPALSLTIHNAAAEGYGLTIGLVWWTLGLILAVGYFVFIFRTFRGRVAAGPEEHY